MSEEGLPAAVVSPRSYTRHGVTISICDRYDDYLSDFGKATLADRYLVGGERYQDMFARVAIANSDEYVWGDDSGHAQRIYDYIAKGWFMPSTPVLSNSGLDRGLPISCFLNLVEDSMESIAAAVTENIWLACRGGGIGTCWSSVRSINEAVNETGKTSGIIPFLHWQDAQTLAISQGSLRRGSAAAYLDVSHPEIEEFIEIRKPTGADHNRKALNLHHGITVSEEFMKKATSKDNQDWDLISPHTGAVIRTINARDLWIKILTLRVETGEPYIIFQGAVDEGVSKLYKALGLKVRQSNLCSEITLATGPDHHGYVRTAVCCLSSLNMEKADDWLGDDLFVSDVLRFLDNVLENFIIKTDGVPGFERARYAATRERSVGLGMMGFHSYLQSKGIPFESVQARGINTRMWAWLKKTADAANVELAKERGACHDAKELGEDIRLTHIFSIAPTASISIIANESSPAGEPYVANSFAQKTLSGTFNVRNKHLDKLLRSRHAELRAMLSGVAQNDLAALLQTQPLFKSINDDETLEQWLEEQWQSITVNDGSVQHLTYLTDMEKATFKTAFEMDQRWVIEHAADRQPYICQAQSTNIFLRSDVHKKDLWDIHKLAWERGLKSLYYLRSRSISKAMVVGNQAGEMPSAAIEQPGKPLYEEPLECLACQ